MRELPYFKFFPNEWITGDVSFMDFETQGLFINLCAYYWSKNGTLSLDNAKRKFSECKPNAFDLLLETDIISLDSDGKLIVIKFLDEQMGERSIISKTNSRNGSKGGRPKKPIESENKPTALIPESETKAKKSNKEKKRKEKELNIGFEISLDPFGIDFNIHWQTWLGYKRSQFGFKYASIESEQIAFNQLVKKSKENRDNAIAMINNSIANGWMGLIELKSFYPQSEISSQTIINPRPIGTTKSMFE